MTLNLHLVMLLLISGSLQQYVFCPVSLPSPDQQMVLVKTNVVFLKKIIISLGITLLAFPLNVNITHFLCETGLAKRFVINSRGYSAVFDN